MRADQYERLQSLSEKLTDVALVEAQPAHWPGDGKKPAELTRDERGDRYWCKKNAFATLGLLQRVTSLISMVERLGHGDPAADDDTSDDGHDLDRDIAAAEADGAALLERLNGGRVN